MLGDILIAAGIGFTQFVITWYGIHVSVERHRVRNAIIIGVIGAAGIGLTVWGAIRGSLTQQNLQAQLTELRRGQQTTNAGIQDIKSNPPIVNVNPPPPMPSHTHLFFEVGHVMGTPPPFAKGIKPAVNIAWGNGGDFVIRNAVVRVIIVVIRDPELNGAFNRYRSKVILSPSVGGGDMPAHLGRVVYRTFYGSELTDAIAKNEVLCGLGIANWKDDSGHYETTYAECTARESDGGWNWHDLPENNRETKLRN